MVTAVYATFVPQKPIAYHGRSSLRTFLAGSAMNEPMFIFDVHLDLSMNAMEWNRNLRWSLEKIRRWELTMKDKVDRGNGTVCFPEMRRGRIGLCVATQIAR